MPGKKKKTNIKLRPAEHVENRSKLIGNGIDLNRTIAKAAHPLNSWYPVIKHGNGHPPSMIFPFPIAMDHQLKWWPEASAIAEVGLQCCLDSWDLDATKNRTNLPESHEQLTNDIQWYQRVPWSLHKAVVPRWLLTLKTSFASDAPNPLKICSLLKRWETQCRSWHARSRRVCLKMGYPWLSPKVT